MPISTIPLSRTIGYASQFVRLAPLYFAPNNDPSLTNADWVKQFMLAAPLAWRWNRTTITFQVTPAKTDYVQALSDFGWLEKAYFVNPNDGNSNQQLEVFLNLQVDTTPNLPQKISTQFDDGEGNITFRVFPTPDQIYEVTVEYQRSASIFTDTANTWAPIPDYMSYIYNEGFLAKTYEYIGDARFTPAMQLFLQHVVAAENGLTDTQKSLFLEERMILARQQAALQQPH